MCRDWEKCVVRYARTLLKAIPKAKSSAISLESNRKNNVLPR